MGIDHILIVDDEESIRTLLQRYFEFARPVCQVVTANNGDEALAHLKRQPFDLAVIDYQMPGLNGLDLAHSARQILPKMGLLLITGSCPKVLSRAINQGIFDGYLDKPFTPEQFISMVDKIEHRLKVIN